MDPQVIQAILAQLRARQQAGGQPVPPGGPQGTPGGMPPGGQPMPPQGMNPGVMPPPPQGGGPGQPPMNPQIMALIQQIMARRQQQGQ